MFLELAEASERFGVAHWSLQHDHIHLIVEARDKEALSSGIRSLMIRFAKRFTALFGETNGKVWGDRYHAHTLRSPRETRNALVYVLINGKKHGEAPPGVSWVDPYSSALELDGWQGGLPDSRVPTRPPRTWMLRDGWKKRASSR